MIRLLLHSRLKSRSGLNITQLCRFFSEECAPKENIVYTGTFGPKLKSIRRVSITSSIVSTIGFPIAISIGASTVMPLAGQIAMASTIILTSLGSTLFLQLVCHPYVTELVEIIDENASNKSNAERRFQAKRINIFGRIVTTEFAGSEVVPIRESIHPFASFKIGNSLYYVQKSSIVDPTIQQLF